MLKQLVEAYNAMGMEGGDDDDEYDEEGDGDVGQQTNNGSSFGHFADNNSKLVLMIRVSNVEFDIGCAPVTEETVKIIFNKPIDIVMSSDTMETSGRICPCLVATLFPSLICKYDCKSRI